MKSLKYFFDIKFLIIKFKTILTKKIKGSFILSLLLTLLYLYGDIVVYDKKPTFIFLFKYLLVFFVYYLAIHLIYHCLNKNDININGKIYSFIKKRTFIKSFVLLLILWLPHLIIKYPISNNYDAYQQLLQGLGYKELSAHYPLFQTILLTAFYKLGVKFFNANIGMLLFSLVEAIVLALIFSNTISFVTKYSNSKIVAISSILFFCFCPYIVGYIGQSIYDVYYSGFVVLLITIVAKYIIDYQEFLKSRKNLILLFVSSVFTVLFRKNGIVVIAPTLFILIVIEIKRKNKNIFLFFVLIMSIISPLIIYNGLEKITNPKPASVREALSIPFQQTARLIIDHEELITEYEKEIINKVLDYESISEVYKDYISDPVKKLYKDEATTKELFDYFVVWFKQFFRAPLTYLDALGRMDVYVFYPRYNTYVYFVDCNNELVSDQDNGLLQTPLTIKNLQDEYITFICFLHYFPLFYFVNNMSSFIIFFLIIVLFLLNDKQYKKIVICVPILISLLILIASPCVREQPRYAFPIIWSFPIWFSLFKIKPKNDLIS